MKVAVCSVTGHRYIATEVSDWDPVKRRAVLANIVCPKCAEPAFFRSSSWIADACFFSRSHKDCCKRIENERGERDSSGGYGVTHQESALFKLELGHGQDLVSNEPSRIRSMDIARMKSSDFSRKSTNDVLTSKRLGTVLRDLLSGSDFQDRYPKFELDGSLFSSTDFFVPFVETGEACYGKFGGFWGEINDAKFYNGAIWLNTGGYEQLTVIVEPELWGQIVEKYNVSCLSIARAQAIFIGRMYDRNPYMKIKTVHDLYLIPQG